ncbi:unnamed protein product [Urochloa humidicola]
MCSYLLASYVVIIVTFILPTGINCLWRPEQHSSPSPTRCSIAVQHLIRPSASNCRTQPPHAKDTKIEIPIVLDAPPPAKGPSGSPSSESKSAEKKKLRSVGADERGEPSAPFDFYPI